MSNAAWLHDCDTCTYLGSAKIKNKTHDFYHCNTSWGEGSIIARYSSDGPKYTSMPLSCCGVSEMSPAIAMAYQLWRKR